MILLETEVKKLFQEKTHQQEVILGLFEMAYGKNEWDKIAKTKGYCHCNKNTWMAIAKMFTDFDWKHHHSVHPTERVLPGGCWMNYGFSVVEGNELQDWEVKLAEVEYCLA
jgi:hypothetical protein